MYRPEKTTYAQLAVVDVPGLVRGAGEGKGVGDRFLDGIREADALVHLVRAFHNPEVPHVDGGVDPVRDLDTINMELLLADLQVVENRLERLACAKKLSRENQRELEALGRIRAALEGGEFMRKLELSREEEQMFRGFGFLTQKPMLVVINLDEDQARKGTYPEADRVRQLCRDSEMPLLEMSCRIEMEINQVTGED